MKRLKQLFALCLFSLGFGMTASSFAADSPAAEFQPRERDKVCTVCHNESWRTPVLSIYQTKMGVQGDPRTPACQTCHGASEGHLKQGPGTPPDMVFKKGPYPVSDDKVRAGQCLTCHKGKARTHWEGSAHQNNQVACNDCHKIHAPADRVLGEEDADRSLLHLPQRAARRQPEDFDAPDRGRQDRLLGLPQSARLGRPELLKKNTVNETCYTCHAEKRGPFLWEHQPVVENCTNCHTPHGSNITPLLKSRPPFLCQACHDGPHSSESPLGRNAAGFQGGLKSTVNPSNQATGRACLNCHSQIHGSNSPSGGYFQR